jgi:cytochrome c
MFRQTLAASLASFALLVMGSTLSGGSAQTKAAGAELFQKRCGGCHALDRDKGGPRLAGVYGRAAGSVDSFPYSAALRSSQITWTAESLDQWLTDPEKLVPGNDMPFHVEKPDERSEIIEYLKQNSRSGSGR